MNNESSIFSKKEKFKKISELKNKHSLNIIDLFSGCGGMSLGFKWAGFNSIIATDIDENAKETYNHNFPKTPFINKDLRELTKNEFDKIIDSQKVDVVVGGPPCQGFSLANKRRNKIKDDPRNELFYDFVKVVDWYKPKAFVMENVKGLLSMKNGEVIKVILQSFEDIGYTANYKVLKASNYGVPQDRERVFIIGYKKNLNIPVEFPKIKISEPFTIDEAISDLPIINSGEGEESVKYSFKAKNSYQEFMRLNSKKVLNHVAMRHTPRVVERFKAITTGKKLIDVWDTHGAVSRGNPNQKSKIKFSQNNFRVFPHKPAPTIAASFQSNFIHPYLHRNFTAREGARLQSFPDNFEFKGMRTKMSWEKGLSQYQQIGNAVPPLLAKAIAEEIYTKINPL
ncbi:DNA cytosine methyltransferase [Lutibacter sp. TH_r2]|uniref:DNA cytosine methyltransferase n=1 Tax=Lutibacter sp. TH_r2 TaxID=3082083 RepID=UPI002953A918|nr:DNA cytosine methyltransferase [Lutibacter sp. TH_r2]MDV7187813.1 DNA cytosine methyltransferase [Lutibacter sp. TH_r2]